MTYLLEINAGEKNFLENETYAMLLVCGSFENDSKDGTAVKFFGDLLKKLHTATTITDRVVEINSEPPEHLRLPSTEGLRRSAASRGNRERI